MSLLAALMVVPAIASCQSPSEPTAEVTPDAEEQIAADPEVAAESSGDTIVDVAIANGSFDTLVAAVQAADLVETLSGEGPFTVFAPTDEAFAALPEGTLDTLLLPENQATLAQILTYHVLSGEVPSGEVTTGAVATVADEELEIVADESGVTVGGATVVTPDVEASNGIIHVIDTVLLPPSLDLSALE
ncbi:fasciclin domain-containing protein [Leptolyngbyaceae cyanobacterium CCMR0082]|uniref:Fasciclin domain-containing protein n=3 Tax=Adonisia TaxID=2950183 RepID=A0A6M0S3Q8_9CYAN|nr:fasciclin domain-containing protein [Adonisia turfae CCMR0081]NEZ62673.1 fasciclin domain-containing protein [Adonisia turfae CCMR0082]